VSWLSATLDETDVRILQALLKDGRATYRSIAKSLALSTPTIQARVRKMRSTGLLKGVTPLLDADKLGSNITSVMMADVDLQQIDSICQTLSELDEVREIYLTTGDHNLILKISVYDVSELQELAQQKLAGIQGLKIASSYVLTKACKEEQRARLRPGMRLKLRCEKCGAEIKGEPVTVKVGDRIHYYCCKVCAGMIPER